VEKFVGRHAQPVPVVDDGRRQAVYVVAHQGQQPGDDHVVVVHEAVGGRAPHAGEELTPDYVGAAADAAYPLRRPGRGGSAVQFAAEAQAGDVDIEPVAVDHAGRLHDEHPGTGRPDLRSGLHESHQLLQPIGLDACIHVERGDIFAAGHGQTGVDAASVAKVAAGLHVGQPRVFVTGPLQAAVRGAVVHHDGLAASAGLTGERIQAGIKVLQAVVVDHDHGDLRLSGY